MLKIVLEDIAKHIIKQINENVNILPETVTIKVVIPIMNRIKDQDKIYIDSEKFEFIMSNQRLTFIGIYNTYGFKFTDDFYDYAGSKSDLYSVSRYLGGYYSFNYHCGTSSFYKVYYKLE